MYWKSAPPWKFCTPSEILLWIRPWCTTGSRYVLPVVHIESCIKVACRKSDIAKAMFSKHFLNLICFKISNQQEKVFLCINLKAWKVENKSHNLLKNSYECPSTIIWHVWIIVGDVNNHKFANFNTTKWFAHTKLFWHTKLYPFFTNFLMQPIFWVKLCLIAILVALWITSYYAHKSMKNFT